MYMTGETAFFVESQKDILALLKKASELKSASKSYQLILSPHFEPALDNALLRRIEELTEDVKSWSGINQKMQGELTKDIDRMAAYAGEFAEEHLKAIDDVKESINTRVEYISDHVKNLFSQVLRSTPEVKQIGAIKNTAQIIFLNAEFLEKELKKLLEEIDLEKKLTQKQHLAMQQELANRKLRKIAVHYKNALKARLTELKGDPKYDGKYNYPIIVMETVTDYDISKISQTQLIRVLNPDLKNALLHTTAKITELSLMIDGQYEIAVRIHFDATKDKFLIYLFDQKGGGYKYPTSASTNAFLNVEEFFEQTKALELILDRIHGYVMNV